MMMINRERQLLVFNYSLFCEIGRLQKIVAELIDVMLLHTLHIEDPMYTKCASQRIRRCSNRMPVCPSGPRFPPHTSQVKLS